MELDTVVSIINSVGFPIAMCCFFMYMFNKFNDQYRQDIADLRKTVENNTRVVDKLCTILDFDNNTGAENE